MERSYNKVSSVIHFLEKEYKLTNFATTTYQELKVLGADNVEGK